MRAFGTVCAHVLAVRFSVKLAAPLLIALIGCDIVSKTSLGRTDKRVDERGDLVCPVSHRHVPIKAHAVAKAHDQGIWVIASQSDRERVEALVYVPKTHRRPTLFALNPAKQVTPEACLYLTGNPDALEDTITLYELGKPYYSDIQISTAPSNASDDELFTRSQAQLIRKPFPDFDALLSKLARPIGNFKSGRYQLLRRVSSKRLLIVAEIITDLERKWTLIVTGLSTGRGVAWIVRRAFATTDTSLRFHDVERSNNMLYALASYSVAELSNSGTTPLADAIREAHAEVRGAISQPDVHGAVTLQLALREGELSVPLRAVYAGSRPVDTMRFGRIGRRGFGGLDEPVVITTPGGLYRWFDGGLHI